MPRVRPPEPPLARERMVSQLLGELPALDAVAATRHLLAVQAQDPRAARLALRVRSIAEHARDIDAAMTEDRRLIITWANRGTLHLICAEDEPWLHRLTTPPLRTANRRRLAQENVSPAQAQRGEQTIVTALTEHGPMTRSELRDQLERAGVPVAGQAFIHILLHTTLEGHIVRGPMRDGEQAFVLAHDWLGPRPRIDRDQALAELARRYLHGHGPAGERDLAKWAGLPLRDVRRGLDAIARQLVRRADGLLQLANPGADVDGSAHPGNGRSPGAPAPPPRLLGPFDPLLLGWADRGFLVDPARHVITSNGIIKAIVLIDGRAAGTWTLPGGRVNMELWPDEPPVSTSARTALAGESAEVERFLA